MRLKIFITYIISIILLFTGCNNNNNFSKPMSNLVNNKPAFHGKTVHYIYTPSQDTIDNIIKKGLLDETLDEIKNKMVETYGIPINIEFVPQENYYEFIKIRLHSNDNIDVFTPRFFAFPNSDTVRFIIYDQNPVLQQWINEFDIADLTDVSEIYFPELKQIANDRYIEKIIEFNGRIYGVPGICNFKQGNLLVLTIDKTFYDQLGRPSINDIHQLQELIKNTEKSYHNGKVVCSFNDYLSWHCSNNGYIYWTNIFAYDRDQIITLSDTELLREAYESFQEIAPMISDDISSNYQRMSDKMKKSVLLQVCPYYRFKDNWMEYTDHFVYNFEFMFLSNGYTITYDECWLKYLVNGASDNIEATLVFLRCLEYDQEIYDLIRYGIKDKHYTLNKNGSVFLDKNMIYGWDDSNMLVSPALERPFFFEWNASSIVWENLINKQNYIIDGVDYRGLLDFNLNAKMLGDDLYESMQNLSIHRLFDYLNSLGKPPVNSIADVIRSGIGYDDFIKHYDSEVVEKLIKEIQDKIIKERGNMDIDKQA